MSDARQRIENAAVDEFVTHGYHGARVQRIVGRAQVNKQLLYYYFGSKRQLYEHALNLVAKRITPSQGRDPSAAATPGERLRQVLRQAADQLSSQPGLVRASLLGALEHGPPDGQHLAATAQELSRRVSAEISRGQGLGFFRDDVDPEDCGRQAAVLLLGWVALDKLVDDSSVGSAEPTWIDSVIAFLGRSLTW